MPYLTFYKCLGGFKTMYEEDDDDDYDFLSGTGTCFACGQIYCLCCGCDCMFENIYEDYEEEESE